MNEWMDGPTDRPTNAQPASQPTGQTIIIQSIIGKQGAPCSLPCSSCSDLGVFGVLMMETWSGFQDLFLENCGLFCTSFPKGVSPKPKDIESELAHYNYQLKGQILTFHRFYSLYGHLLHVLQQNEKSMIEPWQMCHSWTVN